LSSFDGDQVVDAEAVRARDEADAAAEHEAWDADGRAPAADGNEAGVRGLQKKVEVAPAVAGLGPDHRPFQVQALGGHAGQIDDHATLVETVAGRTVAAAAHRERHLVLDGELVGGDDVLRVDTHRHDSRAQVDASVVDDERLVVPGLTCFEQLTGQILPELLQILPRNHEFSLPDPAADPQNCDSDRERPT
jgi:hypothetical protein